jgi:DNA-binding response OmpR family regulator
MIADRVWGHQFDTGTNVIDVYVNYVRKKLHTLGADPIRTIRGVGYVFEPDSLPARAAAS